MKESFQDLLMKAFITFSLFFILRMTGMPDHTNVLVVGTVLLIFTCLQLIHNRLNKQ